MEVGLIFDGCSVSNGIPITFDKENPEISFQRKIHFTRLALSDQRIFTSLRPGDNRNGTFFFSLSQTYDRS